uniref:Uncharacterized protein n=1 Tax=Tetraselmis sp. GSL018 TaxID=582737 RepID=A0A061RA89_9CHLO
MAEFQAKPLQPCSIMGDKCI